MLERVRPRRLDLARSSVSEAGDHVILAHDRRHDWDIQVDVDQEQIIVGNLTAHEQFFAPPVSREDPRRPWPTPAVDFIAELMRGEIGIRTTYRGRFATHIEHGRVGADGELEWRDLTVPLTPAALLFFLPRRTEVERPTFEAGG